MKNNNISWRVPASNLFILRSCRERHRNSISGNEVELMVLRSNLVPGGIAASHWSSSEGFEAFDSEAAPGEKGGFG